MIRIRRIYEKPAGDDGVRILVDRLWPRGVKRENAKIDYWMKDLAPSDQLRQWFGHDPKKWPEFQRRYRMELATAPAPWTELLRLAEKKDITLLFGSKNQRYNNAVALAEFLQERRQDP
jgi:uncharacterized protein YeaO (DUF488 family)